MRNGTVRRQSPVRLVITWGWFTNAFGHKREELVGELTVPRRLFPIEVAEVLVDNVSDRLVQRTDP